MRPVAGGGEEERRYWEVLELIGAYAAGELEGEEERKKAERLIFERADYRRLAESYDQMLAMLTILGSERVEAPSEIVACAVRRAYISAALRQVQQLAQGLVGDYLGALAMYLGLRPVRLQ